ncbi:MAG: Rab geranylgeranyltransferase [Icmadophila ericetorum]|nr:Rab geranylgeranyltransferase [Icmadophila ericetorum]
MTSHGVPRVSEVEPRSEQASQKELKRIADYKELVEKVESRIRNQDYTVEVLGLTSELLKTNPEYYTIWNHRRRILQHQFALVGGRGSSLGGDGNTAITRDDNTENLITKDLQFLVPLLLKFPKCYWMWNHRLWLLRVTSGLLPQTIARKFWSEELVLVSKMLSRDNRNFHGWGYRRHVVTTLESAALNPDAKGISMAREEFDYTTRMITTKMSNFSAWHSRSKLIPKLLDEAAAGDEERRKLLDKEIAWIQEALFTDPYDQSLWFYHQYLMCTFDTELASQTMAPNITPNERLKYISNEIEVVLEILEGDQDCKWIYQSLLQLSTIYKRLSGNWPSQASDREKWMVGLQRLDALRKGRWTELAQVFQ